MPADFNKPVITDTYINVLAELRANDTDLAIGLDPALTSASNVPNNAIRWTSAGNKWQKYSTTTSSWNDLSSGYAINITGNATTATSSTTQPITDSSTLIATTAFVQNYSISNFVQKDSDTGAAFIPSGTTAQRTANAQGRFRFNKDLLRFEGNNGTSWGSMGGATGGGNDAAFYLNDKVINNNYTIAGTQNAMSAGPISIANGIVVTVSDGATWTVV